MYINTNKYLKFIKHKSFGLLGMGRSTLSTRRYLKDNNFNVCIWDDDKNVRNRFSYLVKDIVNFKDWDFSKLDGVVVSPGISLFYPQEHPILKYIKKYNLPLLSDIELFYYFFPNYRYIGVTGTNGKTSLVTFLAKVFKLAKKNVYVAGNIGVPIFTLKNLPPDSYVILELSSFQLSFMHKMRFNIAALINVFPNHDKYHGGYTNYVEAKLKIFLNQTNKDFALINIDQQESEYFPQLCKFNGKVIKLSLHNGTNSILYFNEGVLYKRSRIFTPNGNKIVRTSIYDFNSLVNTQSVNILQMILFGYAISNLSGIPLNVFLTALKTFKGLPHRQETFLTYHKVQYINDSKATTPAASAVALASYDNIYWIVGGIRKSGSLDICSPYFNKVTHVFIYGPDTGKFIKELRGKVNYSCYDNLKSAIEAAYNRLAYQEMKDALRNLSGPPKITDSYMENIKPAVVLFSPVGASFDEFKNFEERGEFFKKTIKECVYGPIQKS